MIYDICFSLRGLLSERVTLQQNPEGNEDSQGSFYGIAFHGTLVLRNAELKKCFTI